MTTYTMYMGNIDRAGQPELVLGEMVAGNYFRVMGVAAARGRTFLPEEDATPGTHPVIVLSDRYWRARHARPFLIGVGAVDPFALLMAPTVLVAVAGLASWLPARRISRVDPVRALRSE